jgi:hypothetical protein
MERCGFVSYGKKYRFGLPDPKPRHAKRNGAQQKNKKRAEAPQVRPTQVFLPTASE